jgi:hypothetical protein
MYFLCPACGNDQSEPPGKIVVCLGCNRRMKVCRDCHPTFTGCSDRCRQAHRKLMKGLWQDGGETKKEIEEKAREAE